MPVDHDAASGKACDLRRRLGIATPSTPHLTVASIDFDHLTVTGPAYDASQAGSGPRRSAWTTGFGTQVIDAIVTPRRRPKHVE